VWLRSQSVGADERKKVTGNQIVNLMPRFNAGKEFNEREDQSISVFVNVINLSDTARNSCIMMALQIKEGFYC